MVLELLGIRTTTQFDGIMPGFAPRHAQTSQLDPTELVAHVVAVLLLREQFHMGSSLNQGPVRLPFYKGAVE